MEKSALSETKAALTVQISRLFSELADLRSQHAMDRKNKQITFMRMTVKTKNNLRSTNKYQKKCLTMITEKRNVIDLLKINVSCLRRWMEHFVVYFEKIENYVKKKKIFLGHFSMLLSHIYRAVKELTSGLHRIEQKSRRKQKQLKIIFGDLANHIKNTNKKF